MYFLGRIRALFHDATTAGDDGGGITFEALKAQLTKHEGLLQVSLSANWEGAQSTMESDFAAHPAAPGSILSLESPSKKEEDFSLRFIDRAHCLE